MKIDLDVKAICIKNKKDLWKFLNEIDYVPSVFDSLDQVTAITNRGDGLPWDIVELAIEKYFEDVISLRTVNPNLQERLEKISTFFNKKAIECKENHESMARQEASDHNKLDQVECMILNVSTLEDGRKIITCNYLGVTTKIAHNQSDIKKIFKDHVGEIILVEGVIQKDNRIMYPRFIKFM